MYASYEERSRNIYHEVSKKDNVALVCVLYMCYISMSVCVCVSLLARKGEGGKKWWRRMGEMWVAHLWKRH